MNFFNGIVEKEKTLAESSGFKYSRLSGEAGKCQNMRVPEKNRVNCKKQTAKIPGIYVEIDKNFGIFCELVRIAMRLQSVL